MILLRQLLARPRLHAPLWRRNPPLAMVRSQTRNVCAGASPDLSFVSFKCFSRTHVHMGMKEMARARRLGRIIQLQSRPLLAVPIMGHPASPTFHYEHSAVNHSSNFRSSIVLCVFVGYLVTGKDSLCSLAHCESALTMMRRHTKCGTNRRKLETTRVIRFAHSN